VVPSNRVRRNRQKLKHRKFYLNMRKNFLTLRLTEHWNRFSREVVDSPSLEMLRTCLNMVLCNLFWVTLLWQGGLDQTIPRSPFQHLSFYDSVIILLSISVFQQWKDFQYLERIERFPNDFQSLENFSIFLSPLFGDIYSFLFSSLVLDITTFTTLQQLSLNL